MIVNKNIDGGSAFDWGKTSGDYAKYRDIYPSEFYNRIVDLGLCVKGQRILDLGTGTGVLPRNLYGHGAQFVGADISAEQIVEAERLSRECGMDIEYVVSAAEEVDFPSGRFDAVTACQCFMYFDTNIVIPKIHKLLNRNGHLCILWMAWLPEEDRLAKASEELVLKYNPKWTGAGFKRRELTPPTWAPPLFGVQSLISYDIALPFTRESWHGRIKACRGIGASSLPPSDIDRFEEEHIQMLKSFPESFDVLHYVAITDLIKIEAN